MSNFNDEQAYEEFEKFSDYSETDKNTVFENEDEILKKAKKGALGKHIDDVKMLFKMIKANFAGEYKLPYKSIAAIIGTLLYIFMPIDLIPDFIVALGLVDDAAILGVCLKAISSDINEFKENQNI